MTPAFVGFIIVALVGGAAAMASAFSGARKNRLDLSVGIALGSASQIAFFVAPVLVLMSYLSGRRRWTCLSGRAAWLWCSSPHDGLAGHEQRPLSLVGRASWC